MSRLRFRIHFLFAFVVLLVVLIMSVSLGIMMRRNVMEYYKNSLQVNQSELINSLDYFYGTYLAKSDVIFVDNNLSELVLDLRINPSILIQSEINEILGRMALELRYPEVKSTYYFGGAPIFNLYISSIKEGSYINNIKSYDDVKDLPWFRELRDEKRMFSWMGIHVEDGTKYISFHRKLIDRETLEDIAIFEFLIPVEKITNIIDGNLHLGVQSYFYLDSDSNVVTRYGSDSYDSILNSVYVNKAGISEVSIDNKKFMVSNIRSELNEWTLIYLLPYETVYAQTKFIIPTTIMMGSIALLVAFFVGAALSRLITRRINILNEKTHYIAQGHFLTRADVEGNDEIAQLARDFNIMLDKILELNRKLYISEIEISEIKAELLQEQVNPHLLYNSLSLALMVSKRNNELEISELLADMINYYKSVLNRGMIVTSVLSEISMIQRYLSIVRSVYSLDISTEFDIDHEIYDLYLVKLFLQPIVENAIIHGIRPMGGGKITVRGFRKDNYLFFIVKDNGAGFEPEVLFELNRCLNDEKTSDPIGYGIINVNKRLRIFFPDNEFKISSTLGEGASVSIKLPAMTKSEIIEYMKDRHFPMI